MTRTLLSPNQFTAAGLATGYGSLTAPSHPIRHRLLRLTADSPELLAIIKAEGQV